jgi:MFS family permease
MVLWKSRGEKTTLDIAVLVKRLERWHMFMVRTKQSLWRDQRFMKLWTGQTISEMGSTVTREAIPFVALLVLGATPVQMGFLAATFTAPVLVVGLVAGVVVDRLRRRPVLILSDLARAVLVGTIPLAALLGVLHVWHLFVIAATVGVLNVLFDVAYQSFLPNLVGRANVADANAKMGVSASVAEVTAPGVAGALVQVLSAPLAIAIDACSYLASAFLIGMVRFEEPARLPHKQPRIWNDMAEGLRVVWRHPLLRAFAGSAATRSFFGNFFAALYGLYAIRDLGLGPAAIGITVAFGGAGDLVGAFLVGRLVRTNAVGRVLCGALLFGGAISLCMPFIHGPALVAVAVLMAVQFFGDAARSLYDVIVLSVQQAITPDHLMGRVNATMQLFAFGMAPFGALAGGFLGSALGVRQTVAVAVFGGMLGLVWLYFSPVRSLKALPT